MNPERTTKDVALKTPTGFLAFGLGSGLSPKAPGTAGTLMAVPFYLLLAQLDNWTYLAVVMAAFVLGIWLCQRASDMLGVHDHGGIVWDEFVGFWITMWLVPNHWQWILGGFLLFRFFDIIKPWPIKWLDQHVHGGFGIMIDDVIAGLYAWVCLILLMRFY